MAFPEPILSIIPLGSLANSIFRQINPNEKKKKKRKKGWHNTTFSHFRREHGEGN